MPIFLLSFLMDLDTVTAVTDIFSVKFYVLGGRGGDGKDGF